jgi:uncharacterized protein YjbI with pentapeptide repeats
MSRTKSKSKNSEVEVRSFINMDLIGNDFRGMDLAGANFRGANLTGANFRGTNLTGANFRGTNLTGANFRDAELADADFRNADFRNANLTDANLAYAKINGANLTGAKLTDAILLNADFSGADLTGANLTGAISRHAKFKGATLTNADLTNAELQGVNLSGLNLRGAKLINGHFMHANLTGADLTGAKLMQADLTGAKLMRANLTDADLTSALVVDSADLQGTILTRADLRGARFEQAINLASAIDADFTRAYGVVLNPGRPVPNQLRGVVFTPAPNPPPAGVPNPPPAGVSNPPNPPPAGVPNPPNPPNPSHLVDLFVNNIGFQVHHAFSSLNIVKFMKIIRKNITPNYIQGKLLQPLINYSEEKLSLKQTKELLEVNSTISNYSKINIKDVQDVITFVLSQPDAFIKMYITNFTGDCLNAFDEGRSISCVRGQYERVFLNLEGVLGFTCNEDETNCPPVYKELLECFKPDYNKLFGEWFKLGQGTDAETNYENKSPEEKEAYINAKKAEFKAYVVRRIQSVRPDIDEYITESFPGFYATTYEGGRRQKTNKRKTNKRKTNKRKKCLDMKR